MEVTRKLWKAVQVMEGTLESYLIQKFIQPSSKPYDTSFKNIGHFHHLSEGCSLYQDNTNNKIKLMKSQQAFQ